MKRLFIEGVITYDDKLMHGYDEEAEAWFHWLLGHNNVLVNNEVGDEIGTVTVTLLREL